MERYGYRYRVSYAAPQTNEYWGKTSYDSDQVRQPVIVDADARKGPVVAVTSQNRDSYGNRTETNYNRPQEVEEFTTEVQTEASRSRFSSLTATPWRSSPEKPTGYNGSTGGHGDRNDYSNKDWQNSPKSTGFSMNNGGNADRNDYSNKDRQLSSPKSPVFNQNNDGYGDRNDPSRKDWQKNSPKSTGFNRTNGGINEHNGNGSGSKDRQKPDTYADRNDIYEDHLRKPTSAKPHQASQEKPAENSLSSPAGEITTTVGYLIDVAKPAVISHITATTGTSIPTAFFTTTATKPAIPNSSQYSSDTGPVYAKPTDVKNPEKRYGGGYNFSYKPYATRI